MFLTAHFSIQEPFQLHEGSSGDANNIKHFAVAVVDNIFSPEALQKVRDIFQESTVWFVALAMHAFCTRVFLAYLSSLRTSPIILLHALLLARIA